MLRMMTISNDLLRYLVKIINRDIDNGKKIERSTLSNAIWDFDTPDGKIWQMLKFCFNYSTQIG